jgi:hypothetical protein
MKSSVAVLALLLCTHVVRAQTNLGGDNALTPNSATPTGGVANARYDNNVSVHAAGRGAPSGQQITSAAHRTPFYRSKLWWTGEAVIIGANWADAQTTVTGLNRCAGCVETNPLLGKRPSSGRVVALAIVGTGAETTFHALGHWVLESDNKFWRTLSDTAIPALNAAVHVPWTIHNTRVGQ